MGKGCKRDFDEEPLREFILTLRPAMCGHLVLCHSKMRFQSSALHHGSALSARFGIPQRVETPLLCLQSWSGFLGLSSTSLGIKKRGQKDKLENINNSLPDH